MASRGLPLGGRRARGLERGIVGTGRTGRTGGSNASSEGGFRFGVELPRRPISSEPTSESPKSDAEAGDRGLGDRDPTRAPQDRSPQHRFSRRVEAGGRIANSTPKRKAQ